MNWHMSSLLPQKFHPDPSWAQNRLSCNTSFIISYASFTLLFILQISKGGPQHEEVQQGLLYSILVDSSTAPQVRMEKNTKFVFCKNSDSPKIAVHILKFEQCGLP